MSDHENFTENELNQYKEDLNKWVNDITSLDVPESKKGVVARFVRDCTVLIKDMYEKESPRTEDLIDFTDSKNSLEIRYNHLIDDLE